MAVSLKQDFSRRKQHLENNTYLIVIALFLFKINPSIFFH